MVLPMRVCDIPTVAREAVAVASATRGPPLKGRLWSLRQWLRALQRVEVTRDRTSSTACPKQVTLLRVPPHNSSLVTAFPAQWTDDSIMILCVSRDDFTGLTFPGISTNSSKT
jgi:hypothetical protein